MVNQCARDGCTKQPCFNFAGNKLGKLCATHKEADMIDVKHKKCEFSGCDKQPTYNLPNETRGRFCKVHKLPDMIDVHHVKCKEKGCKKRPCCNYENHLIAEYCAEHKLDGMTNILTKKCEHPGCNKIPSFNFQGLSRLYCGDHKLADMIDVAHRRCEHSGCDIQPAYNFPESTLKRFCVAHKLDGMIEIISKKCLVEKCYGRAQYNYRNESVKLYCVDHKKTDMVNICCANCVQPGCYLCPNFNYPGLDAKYCSQHKLPDMIDVKHNVCVNDDCTTLQNRNPLYRGHCVRCFIHLFPEEQVSRNYRIKERHVTDYIKEHFPGFKIFYDKKTGGCSSYRPDVYLDLLTHVIVIEIDEDQHRFYNTTCEQKRLNLLFEDFACRLIVFIRFNPDGYRDNNGVKIKSCFGIDTKTGIQKIVRGKKTEWNLRLQNLKKTVIDNTNNVPTDNKFVNLYFDQ